jgi:hypothetical protein
VTTILKDNRIYRVDKARTEGGDLLMPSSDFADITRNESGAGADQTVQAGDVINVSATWRAQNRPVLSDQQGQSWVLGESASTRAQELQSLQAPDFKFPDLNGQPHSLSDYRGKKVFLATWASW